MKHIINDIESLEAKIAKYEVEAEEAVTLQEKLRLHGEVFLLNRKRDEMLRVLMWG